MGSWLTYGLGTENQNLPGYVVLCPGFPVIGPQLWAPPSCRRSTREPTSRIDENDPEKLIQFIRNQTSTRRSSGTNSICWPG